MIGQQTATINFDIQVRLEDRGEHWAAYIEPPGATVYGATEAAVRARVDQAMAFFVRSLVNEIGVERFRRYLDAHGVKNNVIVSNGRSAKMRHTLPVSFLVGEEAVVA